MTPTKTANLFPIRELSELTDVNTVTIRAWERRYGLLKPQRTEKGHRLYSQNDVQRVKNILAFIAKGVPVSKVKALLQSEVTPHTAHTDCHLVINELKNILINGSYLQLENTIKDILLTYPVNFFHQGIIEPIISDLDNNPKLRCEKELLQSAIVNYTLLRISNDRKRKKKEHIVLLCAEKTPIWRMALTAIELIDAGFSVNFINQQCSIDSWLAFTERFSDHRCIVYQEGIWRDHETLKITQALTKIKNLTICGTAAVVANIEFKHIITGPDKILKHLNNKIEAV